MSAKPNSGFTLIELVIVVAILGILATAILTGTDFLDQRNRAKDTGNFNIARNLQAAIEQYYVQGGTSFSATTPRQIKAGTGEVIDIIAANGVLKTGYKVEENMFYLVDTDKGPIVGFSLASSKFRTTSNTAGNCSNPATNAAANGFWWVPTCGQLK